MEIIRVPLSSIPDSPVVLPATNSNGAAPLIHDCLSPPQLVDDLILEILARLPVKALFRYRCVCSSWNSLFRDIRFLKKHVNLARSKSNSIIINSDAHQKLLTYFQIPTQFRDTKPLDLQFPSGGFLGYPSRVGIVGSCNGLVCCTVVTNESTSVYFWNPSTKESMKLPYTFLKTHFDIFGFGFDDSINEFKLVRVYRRQSSNAKIKVDVYGRVSSKAKFEVDVYGMWEGSRRLISDFPYGRPLDLGAVVFVNGCLHWLAIDEEIWVIVSFDLAKETFELVPQPEYNDTSERKILTLCQVNQLLCIVCSYEGSHDDVWIMKEYCNKESWVKLVTIPFVPVNILVDWWVKPICLSKNGDELLMMVHEELVSYNSKTNSFDRDLKIPRIDNLIAFSRDFYGRSDFSMPRIANKFAIQIIDHVDSLFTPSVMNGLKSGESYERGVFTSEYHNVEATNQSRARLMLKLSCYFLLLFIFLFSSCVHYL